MSLEQSTQVTVVTLSGFCFSTYKVIASTLASEGICGGGSRRWRQLENVDEVEAVISAMADGVGSCKGMLNHDPK